MTQPARLLNAWRRLCKDGHNLNATQFLVLCDVIDCPGEIISCTQRGKRLRLTQPTVSLALRSLSDRSLATLIEIPAPGDPRSHHRSYPAITATPTREAYRLFRLYAPRTSSP